MPSRPVLPLIQPHEAAAGLPLARRQPEPRLEDLAVLVPVFQPDERLSALVSILAELAFGAIVLVDDGSDRRHTPRFDRLALLPRVHVLRHAVNRGKGRALKTGIRYVIDALPQLTGLVTADADGQHHPADIVRVAQALALAGGQPVLGRRTLQGAVPLRSRFGNWLTTHLFARLAGIRLNDTQTGLRGLPRERLPGLLALEGERYEYEMTMLLHLCRSGHTPHEVPIDCIYLDGNRSSHFHPVNDSLRVYVALACFCLRPGLSRQRMSRPPA